MAPIPVERSMIKKILIASALVVLAIAGWFAWRIGPSNIWGMLRYDQRREGNLQVGDPAPDVRLHRIEDGAAVSLAESFGGKPVVLIFGSFT
jgi:hypothetical protein